MRKSGATVLREQFMQHVEPPQPRLREQHVRLFRQSSSRVPGRRRQLRHLHRSVLLQRNQRSLQLRDMHGLRSPLGELHSGHHLLQR